jgi:hypothetical protein
MRRRVGSDRGLAVRAVERLPDTGRAGDTQDKPGPDSDQRLHDFLRIVHEDDMEKDARR